MRQASLSRGAEPEPESGQGAQLLAAEIAPSDNVLLPADEVQQTAVETGNPDNDTAPPQLASTDVSLSEAVLSQAFSDDYFSGPNFSSETPAREETGSEQALSEEPPSEAVSPAQNFSTDPVPGPQEDPADLFEPPPVFRIAASVEAAAPVTADATRAGRAARGTAASPSRRRRRGQFRARRATIRSPRCAT